MLVSKASAVRTNPAVITLAFAERHIVFRCGALALTYVAASVTAFGSKLCGDESDNRADERSDKRFKDAIQN